MLTFFRRLRKELFGNSAIYKYLFYAIGEIILVVIGILIALQINNWNQEKINRSYERHFVNDLIQDLSKDSVALSEILSQSNERSRAKAILLTYFEHGHYTDSVKWSLVTLVFGADFNFVPTTTTFEEMKSTGRLDLISNANLRRSIVELYNNVNRINVVQERYFEKLGQIQLALYDLTKDVTNPSDQEIDELRNNHTLQNMIRLNLAHSRYLIVEQTLKEYNALLELMRSIDL